VTSYLILWSQDSEKAIVNFSFRIKHGVTGTLLKELKKMTMGEQIAGAEDYCMQLSSDRSPKSKRRKLWHSTR